MVLEETCKYRVNTEQEAINLIEVARNSAMKDGYVLGKVNYVYKEKKSKGEVIDRAYIVTITKIFRGIWE